MRETLIRLRDLQHTAYPSICYESRETFHSRISPQSPIMAAREDRQARIVLLCIIFLRYIEDIAIYLALQVNKKVTLAELE